jgi:hypothetical protein
MLIFKHNVVFPTAFIDDNDIYPLKKREKEMLAELDIPH